MLAAQELGWREVPTILLDHLSETEAYAFMIADNRVAESAAWNNTLLTEQLTQISLATPDFAIETTGFELTEIEPVDRRGRSRRAQTEPSPNPAAGTTAETGSPRCSHSAIAEINHERRPAANRRQMRPNPDTADTPTRSVLEALSIKAHTRRDAARSTSEQ